MHLWRLALISVSVVVVLVGTNLMTFSRLTDESIIAHVIVERAADRDFTVRLKIASGDVMSYRILGDAWQLDARFLKWRDWATVLGKEPLVRLERLSGRYMDPAQEQNEPRSVYGLINPVSREMGSLLTSLQDQLSWVDTYFGNSVYMPLADGAEYSVSAADSGLIARAENEQAKGALREW